MLSVEQEERREHVEVEERGGRGGEEQGKERERAMSEKARESKRALASE